MESRFAHTALLLAAIVSSGASYRTKNFVVRAPTPELAEEVALAAERLLATLATEWTGALVPGGQQPCLITADIGPEVKSGGLTNVRFGRYGLSSAHISLQGSRDRVLRSVLPHELTHLVFASHFGPVVPRWADEGASITVEDDGEQTAQHELLLRLIDSRRTIALHQLFSMREYPSDAVVVYTQGFSITKFLVEQGGRRKFAKYLADGLRWNNWDKATEKHYAFQDLGELQRHWEQWVQAPRLETPTPTGQIRSVSTTNSDAITVAN